MFDFEDLVKRAVEYPPFESGSPHWARVRMIFGLGSTSAAKLCEYFNIDPDKIEYQCPECTLRHEVDEFNNFCSLKCEDEYYVNEYEYKIFRSEKVDEYFEDRLNELGRMCWEVVHIQISRQKLVDREGYSNVQEWADIYLKRIK